MSETLDPVAMELDQRQLAEQLLAQAKEQGVELVGPNGLLNQLTKNVLETALDAEMAEHLGYDKHDPAGRGSGNSRNGTRAKTVLTVSRPGVSGDSRSWEDLGYGTCQQVPRRAS
ncbi:transposase, Mutator family protein [Mycobacterium intracellulare 1956]|uniref:Mutator family transposase n=1 Tax=Mycobacterium intracellulare 1956 TaxID=1299331 RepID=X8CK57_MYCIT|nr:transposase, Mutator family protein [Mycobacterium intracellulare]EUA55798.1 transposase, Mutator family protein [Mycobacterium intracellulare 1956]